MFSLSKTQTPSLTSSISSGFRPLGVGSLFSSSLGSSNNQLNPPQLTRTPTFNPSNQTSSLQNPSNNSFFNKNNGQNTSSNGPSNNNLMGLNGLLNKNNGQNSANGNLSNNNFLGGNGLFIKNNGQHTPNTPPLGGLFNKNPSQNSSTTNPSNNNLMGLNGLFNKNNSQNPPNNNLGGGLFNKNNTQNPSNTNPLGSFFNNTPTTNPPNTSNTNIATGLFNTNKTQNPTNPNPSNNNLMGLNGLFIKNNGQNPSNNNNNFFNQNNGQTPSNPIQTPGNSLFKNTLGVSNNNSSLFPVSSTSGSLSSNNPTNNTSPKPFLFGPSPNNHRGCFCKNPNPKCDHQTSQNKGNSFLFKQTQGQNPNPQGQPLFQPTPLFSPQIPSQNTQNQPQSGLFPSPLQGLNIASQANTSGPLFNNNFTQPASQAFPQAQKSHLFPMFPLQISQEPQQAQINFAYFDVSPQEHHQPSQDSFRSSSILPHNPFEAKSSRSRAYLKQRYEEEVSDLQIRSSLRRRSQALSSHRHPGRSGASKNDVLETSSFFIKEKKPENFEPLLLYVTLANEERSFAIEVSPHKTCKEVKEAALMQVYGGSCIYDPEDYFLGVNGKRLEDEKTFEELGVKSESQLILEEKTTFRAPKKLPRVNPEYGMNPSMEEMEQMNEEELAKVENFCVWNEEAMVKFEGKIDLRNLDLAKIIVLKNKLVELYPEREGIELPEVGKGLNRAATIEFYNWELPAKYKKNQEKYVEKVNDWAESVNGRLVSFDFEQKIVVIQVKNFNA